MKPTPRHACVLQRIAIADIQDHAHDIQELCGLHALMTLTVAEVGEGCAELRHVGDQTTKLHLPLCKHIGAFQLSSLEKCRGPFPHSADICSQSLKNEGKISAIGVVRGWCGNIPFLFGQSEVPIETLQVCLRSCRRFVADM